MARLQGVKETLGIGRYSFCNIYEMKQFNNNDPQYSLRFLIPKDDTAQVERLQAAIKAAKEEGARQLWGGKMPNDLSLTLHDGDKSGRPEEEGYWCLNTNNKNRQPGIIIGKDRRKSENHEVKSGDWGLINVTFKAYDYGKKGIGAYLNSVWKTKDGESLAGGSTPEEDFKGVDVNNIEFDEIEVDPLTGEPYGAEAIPF